MQLSCMSLSVRVRHPYVLFIVVQINHCLRHVISDLSLLDPQLSYHFISLLSTILHGRE